MKRFAYWIGINGVFSYCLYQGYVESVEGARNVANVFAWVHSIIGLIFLFNTEKIAAEMRKKPRPKWLIALDSPFDLAVSVFLVWHGAILLGVLYAFGSIGIHSVYKEQA